MDTSWWLTIDDLHPTQVAFINLPAAGKYLLVGPAGSGKTNLLVLRAMFVAGKGDRNVLIVTYAKTLCDFIRSGLVATGLVEPEQVKTFHSWEYGHVKKYLGVELLGKDEKFTDDVRSRGVELLKEARDRLPAQKLYSAIFVDEAQDLSMDELEALLSLADNVCVCGDIKQGIYHQNGLEVGAKLGLTTYRLENHYRIGQRVAQVADRLLPPTPPARSLEDTSNYNAQKMGKSTADLERFDSREDQFAKMYERIAVQRDAFPDDQIGIICGKRKTAEAVYESFQGTDLEHLVCYHVGDHVGFGGDKKIHITTMHSAKGLEFRAVHLFGIEELRFGKLDSPTLAFTAVTRAKTALNAYCTGKTNAALEDAFAQPQHFEIANLFPSPK